MLGSDFDTPIIYQDLANYSMGPMSVPNFGAMGTNNQFNGVKMQEPLKQDKVDLISQKNSQDKSFAKKVGIAAAVILGIGFIPVITKSIKKAGGLGKYIKNGFNKLFKRTP